MKKANPKAVGGFVLGAIALAIAVVIVFGSGILEQRTKYVVYFPGSLGGLSVGAPVEMRGVQLGTVTDVAIEVDEDGSFRFPVVFEIVRGRVRGMTEEMRETVSVDKLIERGLRAQLAAESMVTGQQSIQLDFLPDSPVKMTDNTYPHPQVPALPSRTEEIAGSLEKVVDEASAVLSQMRGLLSDENTRRVGKLLVSAERAADKLGPMVDAFTQSARSLDGTAKQMQGRLSRLDSLLQTTEETMQSYRTLAERADNVVSSNEEGLEQAIAGLNEVESKLDTVLTNTNAMIEENRGSMKDFSENGLAEVTNLAVDAQGAVEQLRRVLEQMERNPARFFLGKPGEVETQ